MELERLLSNGNWVRHLARDLLYDKSLTDDVVQEVWITALERPPREPRALPAWLRRVVTTVAFRANRTGVRVARREREASQDVDAHVPSPDEVAQRLELQGALASAIRTLKDPYRTTVYLHFYEGLSLSEIAEKTGVPSSTTRTHLSRALDQLRAKLDVEFGDRKRWRVLAFAWVAPPEFAASSAADAAAGTTAEATGVRSGSTGSQGRESPARVWGTSARTAVWGVVIVGIAGALWLWSRPPTNDGAFARRDDGPTQLSGGPGNVSSRDDGEFRTLPTAPSRVVVPSPGVSGTAELVALDAATGAPVEGATVYRSHVTRIRSRRLGVTDADGIVPLPTEILRRDALLVFADGYVEHREPAALRELSERPLAISLEPVYEAAVRVAFPNGSPAAGIPLAVRARIPGLDPPEPLELRTASDGEVRYPFRHYDAVVEVDIPNFASVSVPARTTVTEIVLRPGRAVRGRVLDAAGDGVAECHVKIESTGLRPAGTTATSDERGFFPMGSIALDEEVSVSFFHPELPGFRLRGTPPVEGDWEFRVPGERVRARHDRRAER